MVICEKTEDHRQIFPGENLVLVLLN